MLITTKSKYLQGCSVSKVFDLTDETNKGIEVKKVKKDTKEHNTKRTKEAIKPRGLFDDVTMEDIMEGIQNKVDNRRNVESRSNGYRWSVNKLRWE